MTDSVARESRPAGNRTAISKIQGRESGSSVGLLTEDAPTSRCRACHHPIHAEKSVQLGIGPVCHRAELGGESR